MDNENQIWKNVGLIRGPQGVPGPLKIPIALFITYNVENSDTGIKVDSNNRLPFDTKKTNENTIYAGASIWNDNQLPSAIVGRGIFTTTSENEIFELVNLGKKIYLNIKNQVAIFTNPVVTLMIQRLD